MASADIGLEDGDIRETKIDLEHRSTLKKPEEPKMLENGWWFAIFGYWNNMLPLEEKAERLRVVNL